MQTNDFYAIRKIELNLYLMLPLQKKCLENNSDKRVLLYFHTDLFVSFLVVVVGVDTPIYLQNVNVKSQIKLKMIVKMLRPEIQAEITMIEKSQCYAGQRIKKLVCMGIYVAFCLPLYLMDFSHSIRNKTSSTHYVMHLNILCGSILFNALNFSACEEFLEH